jgi:hypothetical protein
MGFGEVLGPGARGEAAGLLVCWCFEMGEENGNAGLTRGSGSGSGLGLSPGSGSGGGGWMEGVRGETEGLIIFFCWS